ncbi:DUF4153 domain-containing protein [Micromonospora yangpuensis]|uniref:Uncharacterized protein n=1 Tax=Micromonospora yangpuensis TaxID=683228 RepID=A0A1C6VIE6_9ACTN|nr:DUF4153 domain-containing protein [Micromonospora yangpuensis]SCL66061.1 protein of unknown function [Micromonospora yangpuensis]
MTNPPDADPTPRPPLPSSTPQPALPSPTPQPPLPSPTPQPALPRQPLPPAMSRPPLASPASRPSFPAAPRPSLVQRRWPGPRRPARPVALGAVLAATAVCASVVPLDRPGLGWLVAALAAAAALTTVAATAHPAEPAAPADSPGGVGPVGSAGPPAPAGSAGAPTGPAGSAGDTGPAGSAGAPAGPAGPAASAAPTGPAGSATSAGPAGPAVRPDGTGVPGRIGRFGWAGATLALVAVGPVRAAGWLFVLCLLAAVVTGTLAVTGGRSPLGMLVGAWLPPAAVFRALPWASRSRHRPHGGTGPGGVGRVLVSAGVTAVLLLVFGLLFSSADAVFADLLGNLLPEVSVPGVIGWVFRFLLVGAALLGAAYLLAAPPDLTGLHVGAARPVRRLEWAVPLGLLDVLFAAFVLVQLTVLFGGAGHVLTTAGLSYAEYARGGFWQLLAVSALTLLVLAGAGRWAPRATRADRILFRVLLGTLTGLSLVVVASALYRMQVYTDAYGATRLRLFVATVELALGLIFVFVAVAVLRMRAGWLPSLVVGTAVVALLGLAAVDPDRSIADRNVDRYLRTGSIDLDYLSRLSADAVVALDRLPEPQRSCALRSVADAVPADGLWAANLGRSRARDRLTDRPVRADDLACPPDWSR